MIKKVLKIYLILDLLLILATPFLGLKWLLNSQIAFVCALLIIFAAHKSYKRRINLELLSGKYDNIGEFDDDEEKKKTRFSFTFFAPLKMLSYAFMALCIYILAKFNLFWIVGFLAGTSIIPIGTLIFLLKSKEI
ncbi:MAG: hypothetical protein J6M21_06505 [Campylobacter sp.]|nr:hypothetical protein [Campylobacter sp.]